MVRIAWVLSFVFACSGGTSSSGGGNTTPVARGDDPPALASPGLIAPAGYASSAFRRGLALGDKGDSYAALIELLRVQQGETGDTKTVRQLALYNEGVLALEVGLYTVALSLFSELLEQSPPRELMPSLATAFGVVADRMGEHGGAAVIEHVGKLLTDAIANAAPSVRPQLQYVSARYQYMLGRLDEAIRLAKLVPPESRFGVAATNLIAAADTRRHPREDGTLPRSEILKIKIAEGQHWLDKAAQRDRITAELGLLERTEPAFRTTEAMARMLQELQVQQSLAEADCEQLAERVREQETKTEPPVFPQQFCPPPALWSPPPLVTHTPLRTLAISEPPPPAAPVVADRDKDGVPDASDKCPDVVGNGADGCVAKPRDIDNDGIPDRDDRCPGVAGTADNKGCPADKDSDGDGVLDSKDQCKSAAGPVQTAGCPDGDGDGIADIVDACPKLAGTITRGARAGCKPAPNPKCTPPPKTAGEPTGYACGDGKAKIHVGCSCPVGQIESRDEGAAICWIKPPGC